jgi:hypothetical protein
MLVSEWQIAKDFQRSVHGLILRYYTCIRLEKLRKTATNVSQDSRYSGRDLTRGLTNNKLLG